MQNSSFGVRLTARRATLVAAIAAAFPVLPAAAEMSAEANPSISQVVVQGDKPSSLPTEIPTTIEGIHA